MLGIIVQLAISWLIIWAIEKRHLDVLGYYPTKQRLALFVIFFMITAACCALGFLLKIFLGNQQWEINKGLTISAFFSGLWWNIKSVLFEELIFRGVLLYILIKKMGATKAITVSAIAFGVYHWFSFGVIGNIIPMIYTFFITGAMGWVLGYGYAKSFSLYIPIGIHLGWNFTQIFVFSQGPIGEGIFVPVNGEAFRTDSYFIFSVVTFLPLLLALAINYLIIRKLIIQRTSQLAKPTQ